MTRGELDPEQFLDQLRSENRALRWEPVSPAPTLDRWRREPVQEESSLHYLHRHWVLPTNLDPSEPGGGIRGIALRLFARLTFRVLGRRQAKEQDLIANMVQTMQALARRCDELTDAMATRQVEEAANQARLAAWLHAEPPAGPRPTAR
ncbi:MAG: hypothetical protein ABSC00_06295 [Acidimicrobiales bacterium]|jgi:hypothetical protein